MDFIKREIMTHDLEIAGNTYPAIFNYRAIVLAEDVANIQSGYTLERLNDSYDENGNLKRAGSGGNGLILSAGLSTREITGLVFGMLKAAGVNVTVEDLEESILPTDMPGIIKQLKNIIKYQSVKADIDEVKQDSKNN